jgi:hypothetical protein
MVKQDEVVEEELEAVDHVPLVEDNEDEFEAIAEEVDTANAEVEKYSTVLGGINTFY